MESMYRELELNNLNYKVCDILVPTMEFWQRINSLLQNSPTLVTPEYVLDDTVLDKADGEDKPTVFDDNVLGYIRQFDNMALPKQLVRVKVSVPLYNKLVEEELI